MFKKRLWGAVLTVAVVAISTGAFLVLGSDEQPKQAVEAKPGVYSEREVADVVGYTPRLPTRPPAGVSRTNNRVVVSEGGEVSYGYDARREQTQPERGLSFSMAPRGKLGGTLKGSDQKSVRVKQAKGTISTWEITTPYRPLTSRMIVWSDDDYDYLIAGYGISDDELHSTAESVASPTT